jgi:hypothetical protein
MKNEIHSNSPYNHDLQLLQLQNVNSELPEEVVVAALRYSFVTNEIQHHHCWPYSHDPQLPQLQSVSSVLEEEEKFRPYGSYSCD